MNPRKILIPMPSELTPLLLAAVTIGLVHTALGPDHYIPFVAMARIRGWSGLRTAAVTAVCGVGHVLGSVVLGAVGIALGVAVSHLEVVEAVRGDVAAWMLTAFGLVYAVWGVRRALRGDRHSHTHHHVNGRDHAHDHDHHAGHLHPHGDETSMTPWILFTVFLFGPCEPLIPLLMVPAAHHSAWGVAAVAGLFAVATIATMVTVVLVLRAGSQRLASPGALGRWSHVAAGVTILACGVAIHLGL